ncbi:MAG: hypothetical protein ACOYID_02785 [Eubacteriales bacterium]|jgi:hypothetical protein|nr:hypothetical protein [Clostridiales bacterium]
MADKNKFTPSRVPNATEDAKLPVRKKAIGGVSRNKLFLFIFMPLMIVISGVSVFFLIKAVTGQPLLPVSGGENYVYVLPMSERHAGNAEKSGKNPFAVTGVGLSPVALEGIMYNPDGTSFAILKSSSMTYVKTIGDEIGDTGWMVAEIGEDSVKVTKDEVSELLTLDADASGISIIPEQ